MRAINTRPQSITNRKESTSFEKYLKDISRPECNVLSTEEEIEESYAKNRWDIQARNKLVKANTRFVVSVAKNYEHFCPWLELWDLIWEWNLWLIEAANRFDETRWFKFISYAVWRIRQSILQYISTYNTTIRRPMNQEFIRKTITSFENVFFMTYLRKPTKEEIQEKFPRLDDKKYNNYLASIAAIKTSSLDEKINDDEDDDLKSLIENEDFKSPAFDLEQRSTTEAILSALDSTLKKPKDPWKPDPKEIIRLCFYENKTLEEIAERFGISRERVRQIRDRALKTLRNNKTLQDLHDTLNE